MLSPLRLSAASAAAALLVLAAVVTATAAEESSGSRHASPVALEAFPAPPPGGLTAGLAGSSSVQEIIGAQPFEVASVAVFDVPLQRFRTHIVGAPPHASTLQDGTFAPHDVVLIRRAGALQLAPGSSVVGTTDIVGTAAALQPPPAGGMTAGLAGTNDLEAIVAAQLFEVATVSAWDIASQRWRTYVVGAPATANSLDATYLQPGTPVFLRRASAVAPVAPQPTPTAAPAQETVAASGLVERITYYYCERGSNPAGWGDGGGYCGYMRSGETVYEGAAACAPGHLGERFRIIGDYTERVYTCEDTGGLVGSRHRDVWFQNSDEGYEWYLSVGPQAEVQIVP